MKDFLSNLSKTAALAKENVGFLLLALAVVAVAIGVAYVTERTINLKRTGSPKGKASARLGKNVTIAMLAAIATILMLFDFPVAFVPSFYKMDFSELPVIIAAFAMGPLAGVTTEFIKVLLNLFINGTGTAFVGEFANFIMGCCYVIPASIFYYSKKKRSFAIIGLAVGTVMTAVAGCFLNGYLLIPTYSKLFHMPLDVIIGMGTEKNGAVNGVMSFVVLLVAPFNMIKYSITSVMVMLVYKPLSRLLKKS